MAESIKNFFAGDATKTNIREEKKKILRLVAEHGTAGKTIYREAQRRAIGQRVQEHGVAEKGGVSVPQTLLDEVNQEQVQQFKDNMAQIEQANQQQQDHFNRLATSEELFHEGAVGDAANLERLANEDIANFEASDAARVARGRASGGSGGSGFNTGFLGAPEPTVTLPEDFLNLNPDTDPEGLYPLKRSPIKKPTRSTGAFGTTKRDPINPRVTLSSSSTLGAIRDVQNERLADDAGLIIKNKKKNPSAGRRVSQFLR